MEPRSEERGKVTFDQSYPMQLQASMEPRSEERGKTVSNATRTPADDASMEPRSEERGKTTLPRLFVGTPLCFNGAALRRARKGINHAIKIAII
tara:strand:+ start:5741 stop:6022 length:282 start_codon:yes stop_codon:yes gene_type:complete